jgi:hypothetical protein
MSGYHFGTGRLFVDGAELEIVGVDLSTTSDEAVMVFSANPMIVGVGILKTRREQIAEICQLFSTPDTFTGHGVISKDDFETLDRLLTAQARWPAEIKAPLRPQRMQTEKPWLTRSRRNFKRSQKRR